MSFGAGALGAMTAYSLMRSMSPSYHSGYYEPGYGGKDFYFYKFIVKICIFVLI
jgi:hypothetical protein